MAKKQTDYTVTVTDRAAKALKSVTPSKPQGTTNSRNIKAQQLQAEATKAGENAQIQRVDRFESKPRRVQLLTRPSLYKALEEEADLYDVSMNELINQVLQAFIERG